MVLRLAGFSAFTSHRGAFGVGDIPVVDLFLGLLLPNAVALLDCPDQLIALRFAGDAEMPGLCREVLDGKLASRKAIKLKIQNWQGDYLRA